MRSLIDHSMRTWSHHHANRLVRVPDIMLARCARVGSSLRACTRRTHDREVATVAPLWRARNTAHRRALTPLANRRLCGPRLSDDAIRCIQAEQKQDARRGRARKRDVC